MTKQDRYDTCPLCEKPIKEALYEHLPDCDLSNSRVQA